MNLHTTIAQRLALEPRQVRGALELLDDGNTVPFIARYRKERTGNLDETQIRDVANEAQALRKLESRRDTILETIAEQGKLAPDLKKAIEAAETLVELEDLYAPYRPRRRTRGQRALEAGLEPVARAIEQGRDPAALGREKTNEEYPTLNDVLQGACDILAEEMSDVPENRRFVRDTLRKHGKLVSKKRRGAEPDPNFEDYYDFTSRLDRLRPHQILAVRRGESLKALSAKIEVDDERTIRDILRRYQVPSGRCGHLFREAVADGYSRLLRPSVERDVRAELDEAADEHAIGVFAINLKNLLLQAPLPERRVLGIDPGYRTGCKAAAVDETGRLLGTGHIFVHDNRKARAPDEIRELIRRHRIDVVAVGNGTASAETQEVVAEALDAHEDVRYAVVDEAGASIYSASDVAREEFPDLDVSVRGAVSIARRLQDPLAELVKIDPKSIGVGMYQHDVNQARLQDALDAVVQDVVNQVGVDLNSASPSLLTHISGIGPVLARRIVAYRESRGRFESRRELTKVKGIGARAFEQAAGFLRIRDGEQPLDNTSIHPENYEAAKAILREAGVSLGDGALSKRLEAMKSSGQLRALASKHGLGEYTLDDLVEALLRPGRDPREEVPAPELRSRMLTMDDLREGTTLTGTVRNVVDFGAFVDIGVKCDGLVHVSQMADRYVKNPHEIVAVGDRVEVTVISIDRKRERIGLSMKG